MTDVPADDERHMRRALELAGRAWGRTHPNPMVGAVLVEGGEVVAEGWHRAAGESHAEVEALRALGRRPKPGASLYVTLEPCSTAGRTGACTEAILGAGVGRVVVGAVDPNPAHAGRGLAILREAGVEVVDSVLAEECRDLNLIFNHWIARGESFFAMKIATTLDGKFAAASGHSKWVTGEAARADVMRWRRYFPAIAVSANTVLADDPRLTSRTGGEVWCPRRFVLDRRLKLAEAASDARVLSDAFRERTTVVHGTGADAGKRDWLAGRGIDAWEVPEADGVLDLGAFKRRCGEAGLCGVYFEPGPALTERFIESGVADYCFVYQAPKFMADADARGIGRPRLSQLMSDAFELREVRHASFGVDFMVRGFLVKEGASRVSSGRPPE